MIGGDVEDAVSVTAEPPRTTEALQTVAVVRSFERIAGDGERFVPHRFGDGKYRVADPNLGPTKHHAANQIAISAEEIGDFLKRGYLLRMRGEVTGQVNLVAASKIRKT